MGNNISDMNKHSEMVIINKKVIDNLDYLYTEMKGITLEACEYNFNNPKRTYAFITLILKRLEMCYED